ncbi:MAG: T9SS type A sorting domain-containing protein [Bacteroidales bacterium]|nr:T9SS type A sorting domain-containing protein [Bacteroidales bacterium]
MKKSFFFISVLMLVVIVNAFGQKPVIELTFTAKNSGQYVSLDSILINNLTQGGDTTLYAPDTVLVLDYITSITGNRGIDENSFAVSQNYPNPFKEQTSVSLYLPEKEQIKISIMNLLGREVARYENTLNAGNYSFTFYPGKEKYYIFSAINNREAKTIKMVNLNINSEAQCKIVYDSYYETATNFKSQRLRRVACATTKANGGTRSALAEKAKNNFVFALGDELRYSGYAKTGNEINGSAEIEDAPQNNEIYEFEIIEGIRCPGLPTFTYEQQLYYTVQIGGQCWMKENLNVGIKISGSQSSTNNGTIEKYCHNNSTANCDIYGALYQWNEMMQYTSDTTAQGICPEGWHIPTDHEWKVLEGTVDSQYGVGDPEWNGELWRGFDAGGNLKETVTIHWNSPNT